MYTEIKQEYCLMFNEINEKFTGSFTFNHFNPGAYYIGTAL